MVTPGSTPLWEALPLGAYIQFPWRFLGLASLPLAYLAGAAAGLLPRGAHGNLGSVVLALLAVGLALPSFVYTYPALRETFPVTASPADAFAYDKKFKTYGTTIRGEYLPIWSEWLPKPPATLPTERLDRSVLPPGIQAESLAHSSNYEAYRVAMPEAGALLFKLLYYPAWHAYVDGREVPATPFRQYGLGWVTCEVPAGQHLVELRFTNTPLAQAGDLLSLVSLLLTGGLGLMAWRGRLGPVPAATAVARVGSDAWAVALLALCLFAAKVLYLDNTSWFHTASPPGTVARAQTQIASSFGDEMLAIAYDLDRREARAGDTVSVTIYWQPLRELATDYGSFVELRRGPGEPPVAEGKGIYANWAPSTVWRPGKYYPDTIKVVLPASLPPGDYTLVFGLYDPTQGNRQLVVSGSQPERTYEVLDKIRVVP